MNLTFLATLVYLYAPKNSLIPFNILRNIPWNMKIRKWNIPQKWQKSKNIIFFESGILLEYSRKMANQEKYRFLWNI